LQIWLPVANSTGGKSLPPDESAVWGTVAMLAPVHPAEFFRPGQLIFKKS